MYPKGSLEPYLLRTGAPTKANIGSHLQYLPVSGGELSLHDDLLLQGHYIMVP